MTTFFSVKGVLHVLTRFPSPSQCPSKFIVVPIVTGSLTGRKGDRPILPVKLPVTIDIMINFDGHCDGNGNGIGMFRHTFTSRPVIW